MADDGKTTTAGSAALGAAGQTLINAPQMMLQNAQQQYQQQLGYYEAKVNAARTGLDMARIDGLIRKNTMEMKELDWRSQNHLTEQELTDMGRKSAEKLADYKLNLELNTYTDPRYQTELGRVGEIAGERGYSVAGVSVGAAPTQSQGRAGSEDEYLISILGEEEGNKAILKMYEKRGGGSSAATQGRLLAKEDFDILAKKADALAARYKALLSEYSVEAEKDQDSDVANRLKDEMVAVNKQILVANEAISGYNYSDSVRVMGERAMGLEGADITGTQLDLSQGDIDGVLDEVQQLTKEIEAIRKANAGN